ncbi:hypothetical protein BH09PSE4_BH09PSE4_15140 [soil metagenome]
MLFVTRVALICAAFAAAALIPGKAYAQGLPGGSYQQSCAVYQVDAEKLTALCTKQNGEKHLNKNWPYYTCVGDISNQDGNMVCARDAAKGAALAQAKAAATAAAQAEAAKQKAAADAAAAAATRLAQVNQAKPAFASASVIVLGRGPKYYEVPYWVDLMSGQYGMGQQVADGVKLIDAVNFLKAFIAKPGGAVLRAEAIDAAYREIYGRPSSALEQATWDSQFQLGKAWYGPVNLKEQSRMMSTPALHAEVVDNAYRAAFGRGATASEKQYWMGRSEHFVEMVAANRTWLYSPAGVSEQVETVKRALTTLGQPATDAAVKEALVKYAPNKNIYNEMVTTSRNVFIK